MIYGLKNLNNKFIFKTLSNIPDVGYMFINNKIQEYLMIHQDSNEMPPKMYMMQIIDSVSKLYIHLWDIKDEENRALLRWSDLDKLYHKNHFRSALRKLNNLGLLSYNEVESGVAVEMTAWDQMNDP